ncbi:dihydrofolate reductase [Camelimonas abortus]|uniref:Dihydrofolate reductase n=1 Tax=Camelimonas abortus TaxID=1017184 RepID=A0ABV7LFV1_9HYPH
MSGRALRLHQVVAMGLNGAIGRDNRLPWRLRADMRRFRAITMGHPLIMGRKTWDSLGGPLPGRDMIVLSRSAGQAEGACFAASLDGALALAAGAAARRGVDVAMVIGGAEIYALTLPLTDHIHLTLVEDAPPADAFYPGGPQGPWRADFAEVSREHVPAGPDDERPAWFIELARRGAGAAA